ncbi:beta-N-acetylhexosaminidase [Thiobacter aerophilum]|uniref:Beta-hexosaminidase n=1 Tax=Thiobacter aerophilum TaxID=3121275 RepID=A0ABV0EAH4_9BURK
MLDLSGTELGPEERERLRHPLVGGVILFARNYASPAQLAELTRAIHALREPRLLIGVDHEGGRVQRFREGFTPIPPMRRLGEVWDAHPQAARRLAHQVGYVLAAELRACGVDFSFTPVLDLDWGTSGVIGDRAFHRHPQAVSELAHALMLGMKAAGMAAVGKHFPGHGHVAADSHLAVPVDERERADLDLADLIPFRQMIDYGLPAIMPAHVIYPRVDARPAGFSPVWLQQILRAELGFTGAIFSDDLSMEGASVAGDVVARARAALTAGCDMVLVCNDPQAAQAVLNRLDWTQPAVSLARLARLHGRPGARDLTRLHEDPRYAAAMHAVGSIGGKTPELPLNASNDPCAQR